MRIERCGTRRYRGTRALFDAPIRFDPTKSWRDNVTWIKSGKEVVMHVKWVPHSDGRTHHDYDIHLSLEDVSALVAILGHAGAADDASLLRKHLAKVLPALVKLLACATGLVPTPMKEEQSTA